MRKKEGGGEHAEKLASTRAPGKEKILGMRFKFEWLVIYLIRSTNASHGDVIMLFGKMIQLKNN